MEERININVSAQEYDKTSKEIKKALARMEEMVHGQEDFVITDSEFAFGWHFFIVSVNREMVIKLADMMGEQFDRYKGKGLDKKFINPQFSQTIGTILFNKSDYEIEFLRSEAKYKKNTVLSRFSSWLDQYI